MDARRLPRTAMAVALVTAPLAGLVAAVAQPALQSTRSAEIAAIAAAPDRFYVYALFLLISSYLLVPAFFGVLALLRDRVPRWTFAAGALTQAGLLIAIGDAAVELVYWQMGAPGADHAQMVALAERYEAAPGSSLVYAIGGLASLVGIALISAALWRTRVVPRWSAAALLLGSVANVAGFTASSPAVLIASYVVLLAAFVPVAMRLFSGPAATVPATRQVVAAAG